MPTLNVGGRPVRAREGESVLVALLRAGQRFTGGGCLCLAGDCPHCFARIDGVAYVRTCQVRARDGMVVEGHPPAGQLPPLESEGDREPVPARHRYCDVVVIGQGESGRTAAIQARTEGHDVITLDANNDEHAVGVYPGPLVIARTETGMVHVSPRHEIIVATGASEIQPVAPGNDLQGLVTARAAAKLARAGIDLGRVVAIGTPPDDVAARPVSGALLRFEARANDPGRVGAVVVRGSDGQEQRVPCDTVSVGLGLTPRDDLLRMGRGMPVRAVGGAAGQPTVPVCPNAGVVCACVGVTVDDLKSVHARGFHELELVKRATLAGTGPCQGSMCVPHIRSFLASRGAALQPPFTARPVTGQITLGQAAAGAHHQATPRTALDGEHRRLGAQMERLGGWWRPWHYGDVDAEYAAVRHAVSICDLSTLGKMLVSGPGAIDLLEYLYPVRVGTLKPGHSRYALLLDERGYVIDDGMICRDGETRFTLTFTSGGSTFAELWVRDWAESLGADVRLLNQTTSLGAINVTGPFAKELLARAGVSDTPAYLQHSRADVAGVRCRIFRLSFTGEVSFELHHAASESVSLWRALLARGRDLGIRPHGLEALLRLRLEKGHIIVGQDTDFDSTPRRLRHEWAVRLDKPRFVGKPAVVRTNKIPLDRQLVGFESADAPPPEGAIIWANGDYAGYVTSSAWSPALGKSVMLGWLRLRDDALLDHVTIAGRPARRVPTPFYDPEGARARA